MAALCYLVAPERKKCLAIGERPYMSYGPNHAELFRRAAGYVDTH
jgi:hypothetical protein